MVDMFRTVRDIVGEHDRQAELLEIGDEDNAIEE
jgi:hypothetical protein